MMCRDNRNQRTFFLFLKGLLLSSLLLIISSNVAFGGTINRDIPDVIDPNLKYIFYMHGYAIEQGGSRAAAYNYSGILEELANRNFTVIGEERSMVKNEIYANKVANQVNYLLSAGVPAKNITVAGHSKGGMITMIVMAIVANPDIAYVNFAGCGKAGSGFEGYLLFAERRASLTRGHLLSAYDRSDQIAGSCKPALNKMTQAVVEERELEIGGGHELFYTPKAEWLDILQAWAEKRP